MNYISSVKQYLFALFFLSFTCCPFTAGAVDEELVVAQMNSCVNTLTNIINNKSMNVLAHETDQLLNNLTMQQMVGLPEIANFRIDLIDGIGRLGITEEERGLLKRINSIKQDNLKWQAISSALSNTMMITGGGNVGLQAGFQALTTAARMAVEYKTQQNSAQIEELQAMWELRKDDLKTFIELRKQALSIIFSLYQKYDLKESDRLTEQTSQQFQKITSEPNAGKMVRLLLDNKGKFGHLADYYYYLGMGYIDMKQVSKGLAALDKYTELYNKAPIYRIDEKSGIVALTRLAYNNKLTPAEIEEQLDIALKNLPSNSMAMLQCAATYAGVLKNQQKALGVLRSALDDENTTDKTAIIMAGSMLLPQVPSQSAQRKNFLAAYSNQKSINLDAALNICIANKYSLFKFLDTVLSIKDLCDEHVVRENKLNDKIEFSLPTKYYIDPGDVQMFVESKDNDKITVSQYSLTDASTISLKKIDKVKAFKNNPNLKYLYMYSVGKNLFKIKDNINYNSILNETYPHQSEFILTEKDLKEIVKFLKSHVNKSQRNVVIARKMKTDDKTLMQSVLECVYPSTYKNKIETLVKELKHQSNATYVKLVFNDARQLTVCYKFDSKSKKLIPCYTQYQGKIYFADKVFMKDFGYDKPKAGNNKAKSPQAKPAVKKEPTKQAPSPQAKPATKKQPTKQAKPAEQKKQNKETESKKKPWWKVL